MQLTLNFPQLPLPHEEVWAQLSDADRAAALQALAQLITKAALDLELFPPEVKIIYGIPLSATSKNPFFDRK